MDADPFAPLPRCSICGAPIGVYERFVRQDGAPYETSVLELRAEGVEPPGVAGAHLECARGERNV